jgi:predicted dehydrogenase
MEQVRWGIIGCGAVTEVKSGPALSKIASSQLVAVMRRDKDKAEDYALRHGVPKWYDDADELINDADVNAVYVATPPASHAEYTIRAARAGKPVYVEKPMALNFGQCQEMIDACEAAGVPLFVAYYRRRLPDFLKVGNLVESAAIGEPRFVSVELYHAPRNGLNKDNLPWRVIPEIAGGGHFMDLGSHQLDFLDYVLGPIASVTGRAANQARLYPAEDIVTADFAFESGVLGSGMWCFTVAKHCHTDQMQIVGSKGRITFSSFDIEPVRLETAEGVEEFTIPRPEHVQQPLLQTVVDELLGRGKCPSTGVTAARTSRVMDEILKNQRLV